MSEYVYEDEANVEEEGEWNEDVSDKSDTFNWKSGFFIFDTTMECIWCDTFNIAKNHECQSHVLLSV